MCLVLFIFIQKINFRGILKNFKKLKITQYKLLLFKLLLHTKLIANMEQQSYLSDIEFNPVLASTGKRFLNYLIDIIIFNIITSIVKDVFFYNAGTLYAYNPYVSLFLGLLISYGCFVVLYFLSESAFKGRTIGKFITGTKAVNANGTDMQPKTILIRNLCRIVPFEPLSAFGGHPWHDKWSKTYVIDVKKTALSNSFFQQ